MISTAFHGFCMALADSVPGVSGGTVAYILGFYKRFLDALHDLFRSRRPAQRAALGYLLRLGVGWDIGMAACACLLTRLFSAHIYFMSSLFLGLTVSAVPFVILEERDALRQPLHHAWFALLGAAIVIGLTLLQFGYLFLAGAVAITAMVLPGVSGSSILLIAGMHLSTVQVIRAVLHLQLSAVPGLCALGLGILAGVALSIRAIRAALQKFRGPMVWLILGLMLGSLYAIANGPASLPKPLPALTAATFHLPAFLLDAALLLALEALRKCKVGQANPARPLQKRRKLS